MRNPLILFFVFVSSNLFCQEITTNRNPVGMEHNILFNAKTRYSVTQTGSATLNLDMLFDGKFNPSYTATAPTVSDATTILIENLPSSHSQQGAWVGWSTRTWYANRFKIEGYDVYYNRGWTTLADYSNQDYNSSDFNIKVTSGAYTKLRFTFYSGTGTNGRFGISELHYIHPEIQRPYYGLLEVEGNTWVKESNNIYKETGNVGIGTTDPENKLDVNGTIRATEVKVATGWADFVFESDYNLNSLEEVNTYIQQNGHLPEIPTAKEVEENGISLGEMNAKLLQKIEELTLYTIEQEKRIKELEKQNKNILKLLEEE